MAFVRSFHPDDTEACKHICRATLPPSLARSPAAVALSPYLWTLPFTTLTAAYCFVLDDGGGSGGDPIAVDIEGKERPRGKAVGYVIGCPDTHALADGPRWQGGYVDAVVTGTDAGRAEVPVPPQLESMEPWTLLPADGADEGEVNALALAQQVHRPDWLLWGSEEGNAKLREGVVGRWRGMMHIDMLEPWQGQGWGRKLIGTFVERLKRGKAEANGDSAVEVTAGDFGEGFYIGISPENTKVIPFYERVGFKLVDGGDGVYMVRDVK